MMHQKHYLKQKKEKKAEIASATPISTQQPHQQQNLNVGRATNSGNSRGRGSYRDRGGRHSQNRSGETDPYDMTLAPLNIYKKQSDTGRTT